MQAPVQQIPTQTPPSLPPCQYVYHPQPAPPIDMIRFIDENPRPLKSPRNARPSGAHSNPLSSNTYSDYDAARFAPPYATPGHVQQQQQQQQEYFPPVTPLWPSGSGSTQAYATTAHAAGVGAGHYDFPFAKEGQYVKQEEQTGPSNYTWSTN